MIILIVLGFLVVCLIGWFISTSNNINRIKLKIDESLSGVEIQLRQRYDVLMQGKKVAEQYAQHEQRVFEGLRHLTQVPSNATIDQLNEASKTQEEAVRGFFALGEAYPELKSAEIFNNLINKLSEFFRSGLYVPDVCKLMLYKRVIKHIYLSHIRLQLLFSHTSIDST